MGLSVGSSTTRTGVYPLALQSDGKSNSSLHRPWPDAAIVTRILISCAFFPKTQSTWRPLVGSILPGARDFFLAGAGVPPDWLACDDWFECVPGFLSGPVVDVVYPLSQKDKGREGDCPDTTELQQTSRPNLIDRRHGLSLKNPLVFQPRFVQRRKTIEICVSISIQLDKLLE